MAVKHAKILDDKQFQKLLNHVQGSTYALRDTAIIYASFKAGLRAQEIAGLDWEDVCDAEGSVQDQVFIVPGDIAKKGHERQVPMHPDLYKALLALQPQRFDPKAPVFVGVRKERMTPNAVTLHLRKLFMRLGFYGCSSHSGRRTFITKMARAANLHDCSLKDVQMIAGHKHLSTTERYLELSKNVSKLIASI